MPATLPANAKGHIASEATRPARAGNLLCVANFPANTGYAWDFIETLYAGVADRLAEAGVATWVAYPEVQEAPRTLQSSAAQAVELLIRPGSLRALRSALRFIREHDVRVVYLADQPAWHPAYVLMKLAGARCIICHDHTSGERTVPKGLKRGAKLALRRGLSMMFADVVIGVSDYVVRRKVEVDLVPRARVRRIWNSLVMPTVDTDAGARVRREFGLPQTRPIVVCACRASQHKGVEHLLRAFDEVSEDAALIYLGDGPDLGRLEQVRSQLKKADKVFFAGYRPDARDIMAGADVCVVPSIWQEAFGLAALEPMARGVAVVATRVGGIPEVVVDGQTGILVQPGDARAMTAALSRLLSDARERRRMGENGRLRAEHHFTLEREVEELVEIIRPAICD